MVNYAERIDSMSTEQLVYEVENIAVELQAVTKDLKGLLETITNFDTAYEGIESDEEISTESVLAFIRMARSVKQAPVLISELERISSEANAIVKVIDNRQLSIYLAAISQ